MLGGVAVLNFYITVDGRSSLVPMQLPAGLRCTCRRRIVDHWSPECLSRMCRRVGGFPNVRTVALRGAAADSDAGERCTAIVPAYAVALRLASLLKSHLLAKNSSISSLHAAAGCCAGAAVPSQAGAQHAVIWRLHRLCRGRLWHVERRVEDIRATPLQGLHLGLCARLRRGVGCSQTAWTG